LLGQFTECQPKDGGQPHLKVESLLKEYAEMARGPVLGNITYGHVPRKLTMPFGVLARIDTRKRMVTVAEAAVS
jgi:muramoyltetrapeptide carboxypeptidase LdcA involved in peptidoglycan recycling